MLLALKDIGNWTSVKNLAGINKGFVATVGVGFEVDGGGRGGVPFGESVG